VSLAQWVPPDRRVLPGHRVLKVLLDRPGLRVYRVLLALTVFRAYRVLPVLLESRALRDIRDHRVCKASWVLLDRKD
jgi:hypothetical protein